MLSKRKCIKENSTIYKKKKKSQKNQKMKEIIREKIDKEKERKRENRV